MQGIFGRVLAAIRICERTLIVTIFLAMTGLYSFNVLVREIAPQYSSDIAWIDLAARMLMVWNVFLALGLALERGRHVAVTTVLDMMPGRVREAVRYLINLVGLVFSLYLAWLGVEMTQFVLRMGQVSPTLGIPMFWLYVAPSLGFLLMALRFGIELMGGTSRHAGAPEGGGAVEA
jgi:TRAP-type C4-dicarboxylate transport system permease small subunit